jgi:hypothetical protein
MRFVANPRGDLAMRHLFTFVAASTAIAGGVAFGVDVPITLNYNFNGLVHAGESGQADSLTGYRSISDRGLLVDGNAGSFGTAALTGATGLPYTIITTPQALDVVFMGNRATGGHPYDLAVDGDNFGVRPTWDSTVNHLSPMVTDVSAQNIVIQPDTQIGVLYQISNGGGSFQVVLTFTDASTATVTLAGPDWYNLPVVAAGGAGVTSQTRFGGVNWPATTSNDSALIGIVPTNNLSVFEGVISAAEMIADGLGNHVGKTLQSITFQNANFVGSTQRGYAVLAATARGTASTSPVGAGGVTPNPAIYNETAKIAITVIPGNGSPNNILTVSVDANSINAGTIALNDSGVNGDVSSGDGVWSADFTIPGNAPAGAASISYTITDAQARQGTGTLNFNIVAPPAATNLGTITTGLTQFSEAINPGEIKWVKFTLAAPVSAAALNFLDIDTEGSIITGAQFPNDTYIGLWDAAGNFIVLDDDEGTDYMSALSFGATSPARSAPGNGVAYNGRDGTLAAGTYYMSLSVFPNTLGTTNWTATTTHLGTGTINLRLSLGNVPAGGLPPLFTDLGTLGASPITSTQPLTAGGVQWFKFVLPTAINSANPIRNYLDIDTEGSVIANTTMALFRDDGSGTLVKADDDDGSGTLSQISYGRGSRAAVSDGLAYDGRDGATLVAGTYYVAVTEASATFGNNFIVFFNTGTNAGNVTLNLRTGQQSPLLAGPINNPANGSDYYLLDLGFNFNDAEAFAVGMGGHLASIADANENEFVRSNVLNWSGVDRRGWIGFTDVNSEGTFVWTDNSAVTYTNWNAGEPNNANGLEHFAEMLANGVWNDLTAAGATAGDYAIIEVSNPGCPADLDNGSGTGTPDGGVDINDLLYFLITFENGSVEADLDNDGDPAVGTPDGGVDINDLLFFLARFESGC